MCKGDGTMSQTKAQAKQPVNIVNWILDHAMILIIILMAIEIIIIVTESLTQSVTIVKH